MRPSSPRARRGAAAVYSRKVQEIVGIERDQSVLCSPMQMRTRDATCGPDAADHLALLHRVAGGDQHLAHVVIDGHEPLAVVEIDRPSAVKEVADERDHAAIGGLDRLAGPSIEVESVMDAAPDAI